MARATIKAVTQQIYAHSYTVFDEMMGAHPVMTEVTKYQVVCGHYVDGSDVIVGVYDNIADAYVRANEYAA